MNFLGILPLTGLLVIVLLIVLKVFSLRRNGISVRAQKHNKTAIIFFLYPLFLLLLLLWLAALMEKTFQLQSFPIPNFLTDERITSFVLQITGAVLIFLSVILMFFTMLHFKSSLRFGMSRDNQGKLVTAGVFSYSRNPFFLSLIFYFIGQALIFPGILFVIIALMSVIGIHFFILKEEEFLYNYYKDEYFKYSGKVRRYL